MKNQLKTLPLAWRPAGRPDRDRWRSRPEYLNLGAYFFSDGSEDLTMGLGKHRPT